MKRHPSNNKCTHRHRRDKTLSKAKAHDTSMIDDRCDYRGIVGRTKSDTVKELRSLAKRRKLILIDHFDENTNKFVYRIVERPIEIDSKQSLVQIDQYSTWPRPIEIDSKRSLTTKSINIIM